MAPLVAVMLIGFSLAMDALAATVSIGICIPRTEWHHALKVGLIFGGFQAIMPAIGWFLGSTFQHIIQPIDHWIALILLVFIGGHMVYDAQKNRHLDADPDFCPIGDPMDTKRLLGLGVATSIDALAAGVTFSIEHVNLWVTVSIIGVVTFLVCVAGIFLSKQLGRRFRRRACMVGGIVLVLYGLKIFIEHTVAGI